MANRPCRPSSDVKGIWQLLLPDTPFPACGTAEVADANTRNSTPPAPQQDATVQRDGPPARRG
jgi:hypothetical protein